MRFLILILCSLLLSSVGYAKSKNTAKRKPASSYYTIEERKGLKFQSVAGSGDYSCNGQYTIEKVDKVRRVSNSMTMSYEFLDSEVQL